MATPKHSTTPDQSVQGVLAAAEAAHHAETMAAARKFEAAASWAELHPGPAVVPVVDEVGELLMYGDQPVALAGEGAPTVAEFCVAEFAAAVGMSTPAGRRFIGAALETKHRLPLLWDQVMTGRVAAWKARRVTEHTHRLPPEGAAHVDAVLAKVAATCSFAHLDRTAERAAAEYDNEHHEADREQGTDGTYFEILFGAATIRPGLVSIRGALEHTDALALETALKAGAHALGVEHPELPLDVRRAKALGLLADQTLAGNESGVGGRELVIYTHHDTRQTHGIVGVEGTGSVFTIEQLAEWCQHANTRVSIRPVLDLDEDLSTDSYAPTARQREQAILTCPTCVFPGCARSARRCDLDHITAWAAGGATESWNLAPLCRLHHRLKTHGHWTYTRLTKTSFEWTSPLGRVYLSDLTHKRRRTP